MSLSNTKRRLSNRLSILKTNNSSSSKNNAEDTSNEELTHPPIPRPKIPNFAAMPMHAHLDKAAEATKLAVMSKIFHERDSNDCVFWGVLHIKIIQCKKLRNLDRFHAASIIRTGRVDKSDPYVVAFIGEYRLLKTRCIDNDLNPEFNEEFFCPVAHVTDKIGFKVFDKDTLVDDSLGNYFLPASELIKLVDEKDMQADPKLAPYDLKRVGLHKTVFLDGKKHYGTLEFFIEFIPTRMLAKTMEVPGTYFEKTKGNDVKLYMNADDDGSAPIVKYGGVNDDAKIYTPPRLWRDIYDAISDAKYFVYVAGWSIDTSQYLLRGEELRKTLEGGKYSPKIGELFVSKADEGVVVNVMQWDDNSSNFLMPGMMGTFDEQTRNFFKNTKVNCRLMSTVGGDVNTMVQGQSKKVAFTHHQKYIIVDAPRADGKEGRELFAFVGGIDLTQGRWDNRKHPLFRSLQTQHKGDTYTKCFNVSGENGPRQPWHDIHSAVRGPECIQLAIAFEERWTKQGNAAELVNRSRLGFDSEKTLQNSGGWCAQLSRSIDSRVNAFDPSVNRMRDSLRRYEDVADWKPIEEKNITFSSRFETATVAGVPYSSCLERKKGRLVDDSIHRSMIHHIRRARHFIYIESQYFMGSSFMWSKDNGVKCGNMIAAEIAYKICEKIAANEPFAVYILLPMWMEGIPAASATQGLLHFQRVTIEAMYKKVDEALTARMANSSDQGLKVSDYLNMYCLGTRESLEGCQATGSVSTDDEITLARTRRHQIYIHSKMMIVDDDVALIGTANINQRSMDGCRDSEIMMTSWQPEHLTTEESIAKGDIHAFRLHTWASITGQMNEAFRNPSSHACVRAMNQIAHENWQKYIADNTVDMESHLLPFPLEYLRGEIKPRRGLRDGNFPDTKASVLGKKAALLPELYLT
mmetsp:Transcript_12219/g.26305  ORF Transcript_12219/g.26305 Transcript_12219/m.26305 type:complete len:916 (-) Transcript_12219:216-2963(-)